jgi:hypothetical protein
VPKIVDFGLSKLVGQGEDPFSLTEGALVGTVQYMAPEQTLGSAMATSRSDQYALAAVLYECLAGVPPFRAPTLYELIDAVRAGNPRAPSAIERSVPPALDAVVLRAMAPDPAARFPDVRALARELLGFSDGGAAATWRRDFSGAGSGPPPQPRESGARPAATRAIPSSPAQTSASAPVSQRVRRPDAAPPLPCAPGASPFRIKGLAYRGVMRGVSKLLSGGVDQFCEALVDARLHDFVRQPFLASAWYDVLPMYPLASTLAGLLGAPFEEFVRAGIAQQARYDATHVFHRMYDGAAVEDIPVRLSRFEGQYLDFGRTDSTLEGAGRMVARLHDVPAYVAPWLATMKAAYTEEAARIVGASGAQCTALPSVPSGTRAGFPLVLVTCDMRWW